MLDQLSTGGPKLRRWYGAADLPSDGKRPPSEQPPPEQQPPKGEEEEQAPLPLESVLVLDADSPMGELIVLQLILARCNIHTVHTVHTTHYAHYIHRASVRILVKSAAEATTAFGPYVEPIEGLSSDPAALRKALNGAKNVVVPGKLGALVPELQAQPRGVVLVSSVGAPSAGMAALFDSNASVLRDARREADVLATTDACTIVRAARIRDAPGGAAAIDIQVGEAALQGEVCREDLARVVAAAALQDSMRAGVLRVANTPGDPPADVAAQLCKILE